MVIGPRPLTHGPFDVRCCPPVLLACTSILKPLLCAVRSCFREPWLDGLVGEVPEIGRSGGRPLRSVSLYVRAAYSTSRPEAVGYVLGLRPRPAPCLFAFVRLLMVALQPGRALCSCASCLISPGGGSFGPPSLPSDRHWSSELGTRYHAFAAMVFQRAWCHWAGTTRACLAYPLLHCRLRGTFSASLPLRCARRSV